MGNERPIWHFTSSCSDLQFPGPKILAPLRVLKAGCFKRKCPGYYLFLIPYILARGRAPASSALYILYVSGRSHQWSNFVRADFVMEADCTCWSNRKNCNTVQSSKTSTQHLPHCVQAPVSIPYPTPKSIGLLDISTLLCMQVQLGTDMTEHNMQILVLSSCNFAIVQRSGCRASIYLPPH